MANQWFRMYAEFATDPKVQMLSETDQRRYIMLLCIRCNGDVTLQDGEIAFQLRISNEDWAETKAILIAKKLIDETSSPINWDKRQRRSDSSAERVSRHREKKRNGDVTLQKREANAVDSDTEESKQSSDDDCYVASGQNFPNCPHQEIIDLYAECLPELPQPRVWGDARAKNLTARWRWVLSDLSRKGKPCDKEAGIGFFRRMFEYVAKCDLLMGRNDRGWTCSLPWMVESQNFAKIIEGNYENKEAA